MKSSFSRTLSSRPALPLWDLNFFSKLFFFEAVLGIHIVHRLGMLPLPVFSGSFRGMGSKPGDLDEKGLSWLQCQAPQGMLGGDILHAIERSVLC